MSVYLLFVVAVYGGVIEDMQYVKPFETREQCEAYIDSENNDIRLQRMDIYLKYYRENVAPKKEYQLTLSCQPLILDRLT